jgi:hypothetical protein
LAGDGSLGLFGHREEENLCFRFDTSLADMFFFLITCSFIIGPIVHIVGIAYSAIVADMLPEKVSPISEIPA